MTLTPIQVKVMKTETIIKGDAKSVYLAPLNGYFTGLNWQAGQHITLILNINGQEVRRSYSVSIPPNKAHMRITVKRLHGGLVSNHINDHTEQGDVIAILPPYGSFVLIPDKLQRCTHYFFAAGSGITPIYAMIKHLLNTEPHSIAHLVYGNKNHKQIIFQEKLDQLLRQHPDRLTISHVLSKPSMWTGYQYWRKGRVDGGCVTAFINAFKPYAQDTRYHVCGPGQMNQTVKHALNALDVPNNRICMESYGNPQAKEVIKEGVAADIKIKLNGVHHQINVQKNQTVLQAAKQADIDPPYSCESGVCGACQAHLVEGQVQMKNNLVLSEEELNKGVILTCQSLAKSPQLTIEY